MNREQRESTAARLLRSSADRFYDPEVDIDWQARLEPDKLYLAEHRISLYGTKIWDSMSEQQRVELSKQEAASITSFGIYAEAVLMHLLLGVVTDGDPTSKHAQYALTEIAEECRHSTMFGMMLEKAGAKPFLAPGAVRVLLRLVSVAPTSPLTFAGALLVEELLDRLQRESMNDERVQPHVRMVNRIHVLEEARHITYAREELRRQLARCGPVRLGLDRVLFAVMAYGYARILIDPRAYRRAGLDMRAATRAAMANPRHRENLRWMAERLAAYLREVGMIEGRLTTAIWRRSRLL